MKRQALVTAVLTLALVATTLGASAIAADDAGVVESRPAPASEEAVSPERGFKVYAQMPLSVSQLESRREDGHTVSGYHVNMRDFRSAPLSEDFLDEIEAGFDAAREAGVKLVPRFAYDYTAGGQDAPLDVVLGHIDQLAPILEEHHDVIWYLEAGFIGAWGEWHSSANDLIDFSNFGAEVTDDTQAIFDALLDAVPEERMVAVRTPRYKQQLFGTEENLNPVEAFSGSDRARTGFHNDCFLASETDFGTYGDREADTEWLRHENRYVPMGGETCSAAEPAQPYIACDYAVEEMDRNHWQTLNISWNPAVYDHWEDEGCMDEVRRRLGYRYRVEVARMAGTVPTDGALRLQLRVANEGFATVINERPVEIVLRDVETGQEHHVETDADPRWWRSGRTTNEVLRVPLPEGIAEGAYDVLLNLPDAAETLREDPRFSLRLANEGTWEAETGFNDLGLRVRVVD